VTSNLIPTLHSNHQSTFLYSLINNCKKKNHPSTPNNCRKKTKSSSYTRSHFSAYSCFGCEQLAQRLVEYEENFQIIEESMWGLNFQLLNVMLEESIHWQC